MFIDTHTHYYDEWFGEEGPAAIRRSLDAGVGMMLQADVDSRERDGMFSLWRQFPDVLRQMEVSDVRAEEDELTVLFLPSGSRKGGTVS